MVEDHICFSLKRTEGECHEEANSLPNQSQIGGLDGEPLSNGFTTIGPDLDVFSLLVAF